MHRRHGQSSRQQSCFAGFTDNVPDNARPGGMGVTISYYPLLIPIKPSASGPQKHFYWREMWHDESGDPVEGNLIQFTGVSTGTTSGTVKVYGSNASSDELTDLTPWMTGETTFSFNIIHSSAYGTLSRTVGESLMMWRCRGQSQTHLGLGTFR